MSDLVDINEGTTGSNGIFAALFGAAGVGLLTVTTIGSIFCFVICAFLAGITEGVEFRISDRSYRKYYAILGMKIGRWYPILNVKSAELVLRIRKTTSRRFLPKSVKFSDQQRVQESILTFDILLIYSGTEKTRFYEFNTYSKARRTLETIEEIFQIPVKDHYLEQLNSD